jgi:hypothetical protein
MGAPRLRLVSLTVLVIAVLTASAAFGAVGGRSARTSEEASPSCTPSTDQGTMDEGTVDEGTVDEGTVDEGTVDEGTCVEQEDDPSGTVDASGDASPSLEEMPTADPEREAACMVAAGIDPAAPHVDTGEKLKGLDNAIARVLENCVKNPQAAGLINALEHLVANRDRQAAHQEELAAAKAERDAAKAERRAIQAERKAEHQASKSNEASAGTHVTAGGQAGQHGNGNGNGNGNGHGHD